MELFGAGYIYYALNNANDTQELYLSAAYDIMLKPTLAVYYDFDEGNGAFMLLRSATPLRWRRALTGTLAHLQATTSIIR